MRPQAGARLAVIVSIVATALMAPLMVAGAFTGEGDAAGDLFGGIILILGVPGVALLGATILRRTGNVIGWLFVVTPLGMATAFATEAYVRAGYRPPDSLPAVSYVAWLSQLSALALVLPIPLLFLLFPTGRPIGRRWRWAVRAWALGSALTLVWTAVRDGDVYGAPHDRYPGIGNPMAMPAFSTIAPAILYVGVGLVLLAALLGIVSLLLRFVRGSQEERQQLRWIALVAVAGGLLFLTQLAMDAAGIEGNALSDAMFFAMVLVFLVGLPSAVALAVLKYRLYDVDVVISKTLVYGSLAAFITAVYVGIVVGIGSLIGRGDQRNLWLQVLATAVVAVAFQPVRERAARVANRLVYGERATPYEVLSRFSERAAETYATEDVLSRTARIVAEATGASRVDVWLRVGDELHAAATWPEDAEPRDPVPFRPDRPLESASGRMSPIRLGEEVLGAIGVEKPANDPIRPAEVGLLEDLANQAGLLVSNARLTAELEAELRHVTERAAELRASRQRIVAAQDHERRRLERNIHDGAQQHLVALAVKLRLARATLAKDQAKARGMLLALQEEIADALETLTSLALGIYPPLLEEQGLGVALADQYVRTGMPVHLETDGTGRYPVELEAAVYFCVLEALQNASKYADATRIDVRLEERDGELRFEVADDGVGFDVGSNGAGTGLHGMRDRLAVFGGTVKVSSERGRGTVVRGSVPIRAAVPPTEATAR